MLNMNRRHYEMSGEEWYHARKYLGHDPVSASYDLPQSALELYPGHAAYSGFQWLAPQPDPLLEGVCLFSCES
jgi:hypothetical protein